MCTAPARTVMSVTGNSDIENKDEMGWVETASRVGCMTSQLLSRKIKEKYTVVWGAECDLSIRTINHSP